MSTSAADRRIRAARPPRPHVDPWRAHGSLIEQERRAELGGRLQRALTVFLAGAECPFTCSFCDLWRFTVQGPTPVGALPAQLERELGQLESPWPDRLKLYNASNFFDRRAVPAADVPALATLAAPFAGVTVESHARTVGALTLEFARAIPGRLEVAMGLETIHPDAARHLNKRLDPAIFDRAAGFLREHGMDLRVFVLLGAPYVPAEASVEWTLRTAEFAARAGATTIALIPVRGGNGEMERLRELGHFTPPTLRQLEDALDACLRLAPAVVTADLWDVALCADCGACREPRIARLARINLAGVAEPRIRCPECGNA